ncbi:MAG: DUF563 domain-containing protein [Rhodobacteraceae bacterium]|nr:DUF563 domain-containing protein [Paracoccaceae bacterium]
MGFEIFQPEQQDLAEQFRAYQEAETIVTTDGSHCHVIAFARQEGQKLSVISRREAEPVMVRNQLRSFGEAIPSCRTFFLSVLLDEWQPNRRDRSISKGEVDFAALAEALKENGSISHNNPENWYVPTGSEVRDSALEGLRAGEFVMNKAGETLHVSPREHSTPTTQAETMADPRTTPEIKGLPDGAEELSSGVDLDSSAIILERDAKLFPFERSLPKGKGAWAGGVLGRHGQVVPHSEMITLRRRMAPELIPDVVRRAPSSYRLEGHWLFCGLCSRQFGHNLTRGIGRLWALDYLPEDTGLLYSGLHVPSGESRFLSSILDGLGISNRHHVAVNPCDIESLYLAPEFFSEATVGHADPAFANWVRARIKPAQKKGRSLYVSRTRLGGNTGRCLNEEMLEENLRAAGFEPVYPETMSFDAQLATYASADCIVAMEGSALHAIPLAIPHDAQLIVIQRRHDVPKFIRNQISSFSAAQVHYINAIHEIYWPEERADNLGLSELDFEKLRHSLISVGALSSRDKWVAPSSKDRDTSLRQGRASNVRLLTDAQRTEFLQGLRKMKQPQRNEVSASAEDVRIPSISGLPYLRMLRQMHKIIRPEWYFEIGTFSGKSLRLADCNFIAIDPKFQLAQPLVNKAGRQMHLFQQTSDDFFASGFLRRNSIELDLAFLDGMHRFEFLLRDFMNTEKAMKPGGVIAMHDCCPSTYEMASRDQGRGAWTGDVWKTLLILLEHRPDLDIQVAKCAPTGLVVIRNCDPGNRVLDDSYDELVALHMDQSLHDLPGGLPGLYEHFELAEPRVVLDNQSFER